MYTSLESPRDKERKVNQAERSEKKRGTGNRKERNGGTHMYCAYQVCVCEGCIHRSNIVGKMTGKEPDLGTTRAPGKGEKRAEECVTKAKVVKSLLSMQFIKILPEGPLDMYRAEVKYASDPTLMFTLLRILMCKCKITIHDDCHNIMKCRPRDRSTNPHSPKKVGLQGTYPNVHSYACRL